MRGRFLPRRRAPGPRPIFLSRRHRLLHDADFADKVVGYCCAVLLLLLLGWLLGEFLGMI